MIRLLRNYVLPIGIGFAIIFGWAYTQTGSLSAIWPYLSGAELIVSPSIVDLGEHKADSDLLESVTLRNISSSPIKIVGMRKSCGCVVLDLSLPLTIEPDDELVVKVSVALPKQRNDDFQQEIIFFTDRASGMFLPVKIRGKVI